jgi:hypothetical protein
VTRLKKVQGKKKQVREAEEAVRIQNEIGKPEGN